MSCTSDVASEIETDGSVTDPPPVHGVTSKVALALTPFRAPFPLFNSPEYMQYTSAASELAVCHAMHSHPSRATPLTKPEPHTRPIHVSFIDTGQSPRQHSHNVKKMCKKYNLEVIWTH
jgi:hypothetical protein